MAPLLLMVVLLFASLQLGSSQTNLGGQLKSLVELGGSINDAEVFEQCMSTVL